MMTKIHTYNFNKLFPNAPFDFKKLLQRTTHIQRTMRVKDSFSTARFLYINDIIDVLERGLKDNRSPNQHHMKKWKHFLENDIQEFLDNEHERETNET